MKYLKPLPMFHYLMKLKGFKERPLLGMDVGKTFIGVSIADRSNRIARPLRILNNKDEDLQKEIRRLISFHDLSGIVLGWPSYYLRRTINTKEVIAFADKLKLMHDLHDFHFTVWDENTTTKNAEFLVKPLKYSPEEEKARLDMYASTCILQGYLDFLHCDKSGLEEWKLETWSPDL